MWARTRCLALAAPQCPGGYRDQHERILSLMKPTSASGRRPLPTSPFHASVVAPSIKQFAVHDRVTHDRYGLGTVTSVEAGLAVQVDFGSRQERITAPYRKLTKL